MKRICFLIALLSLAFWGCSDKMPNSNKPPVYSGEIAQSSLARSEVDAPQADVQTLVDGNKMFAFDLYAKLITVPGNIIYSPYSISLALAMTYAGAKGETETEMSQVLHYTLSQDKLHAAFNTLDRSLVNNSTQTITQNGFTLSIANAVWGEKDYSFLQSYLDILAQNYGAGVRLCDFITNPENSRLIINNWVSSQTNNRINDLLPSGSIDASTRMVLTNAIYFYAQWLDTFPTLDSKGNFYLLDSTEVTTPMMNKMDSCEYMENNDLQAISIPYKDNHQSMMILLPASGKFDVVEEGLSSGQVENIIDSLARQRVNLSLPKFSFGSPTISLATSLKALGMEVPFEYGNADFSGIDGTRLLFIGNVLHKAFIAVDQKGTEAAAATAVVVETSSAPVQVPTKLFNANRPFIFFIRDNQTGTILFMGRLVDPRG